MRKASDFFAAQFILIPKLNTQTLLSSPAVGGIRIPKLAIGNRKSTIGHVAKRRACFGNALKPPGWDAEAEQNSLPASQPVVTQKITVAKLFFKASAIAKMLTIKIRD